MPMITPDQARARMPVAAMPVLADLQDWERLERCFGEGVTVDYSSLWGGEPQKLNRADLLAQWQALLPGFDATQHQLGPVTIEVDGDEAVAEAKIVATHLLEGRGWIVEGRYDCRLVRAGDGWRIAALAYVHERESGDRDLTDRAKARVSEARGAAQRDGTR